MVRPIFINNLMVQVPLSDECITALFYEQSGAVNGKTAGTEICEPNGGLAYMASRKKTYLPSDDHSDNALCPPTACEQEAILRRLALRAALRRPQPANPENTASAAQTLLDDHRVTSSAMRIEDLRDIASDPSYGLQTRAACQYLVEHPDEYGKVESADTNGLRDGIISKNGMYAYLTQPQPQPATPENTANAAQTLLDDPAVTSNAMRVNDLRNIAADSSYDMDTRTAARYLVDHPEAYGRVESADTNGVRDGIISKNGMYAYLTQPQPQPVTPENTANAAQTLLDDPAVTSNAMRVNGLRDIAADPAYDIDTRTAARYLVEHPGEYGKVESADTNGVRDGIISKNGMYAYLTQPQPQPSLDANMQYLNVSGFNVKDDPSGSQDDVRIGQFGTVGDINKAATSSDLSERLALHRKMVNTFASHPEDLIRIATNPAISDGARALAISALKVMHARDLHKNSSPSGQATGSSDQWYDVRGDDGVPIYALQNISTAQFNRLTTDQKLTRFEERLSAGVSVDPERLRATLAQLLPGAAAAAAN